MVVSIAYRLFDTGNTLRDSTRKGSPLRYLHGFAQIVPGLERGLEGARAGERRTLELPAEDAFGERDEDAVLEIFPRDFSDAARVAVGDEILAAGPDGNEFTYCITKVTDDLILADMNHPLAGQRVRFEVEVLSVRPATDAELDAARLEIDELIVDDGPIDYGTGGAGSSPSEATELRDPTPLIQLRTHSRSPSGTS